MGRRPRSRASRAERRMLKERAASALQHGLPVPTPPPSRPRPPNVPAARSSSVPSERIAAPANRRMPLPVKLLGIGLLLLGVIYGLTLFRDHKSEPESASAAPEGDPVLAAGRVPPVSVGAPSRSPGASEPTGASASLPSIDTGAPRVAADLAGAIRSIPVAPPALPSATVTQPSRSTAPGQRSSDTPTANKALVAPPPSPLGARTNPPARPADNPY